MSGLVWDFPCSICVWTAFVDLARVLFYVFDKFLMCVDLLRSSFVLR